MYLEISDRQTGKTSRLINQIHRDKSQYDILLLLGINSRSIHYIKKICHNNKIKCISSISDFRKTRAQYKDKKVKLYVDEFLYSTVFCNNFNNLLQLDRDLIINRIL